MLVPTVYTGKLRERNRIKSTKSNFDYNQTWKDRLKGLGIAQQPIPFAVQSLEWKTKAADILFRIGIAKKREGDPAAIEWLQCCHDFVFAQSAEQETYEQFESIRQALLHELST